MKVITFGTGSEHFSIDISYLKEVKPFKDLKSTYVPKSPRWLNGLINLRGNLVPLIDLKILFRMDGPPSEEQHVIILSLGTRTIGVLVDAIEKIIDIEEGDLEKPPSTIPAMDAKFISGVKRLKDTLLVHLAPERLIGTEQTQCMLDGVDKRKFARKQTDISGNYMNVSFEGEGWKPCRVFNVSMGGLKMLAKEHINIGTKVVVSVLDIKGDAQISNIEFRGIVAWSKKMADSNECYTGISFTDTPERVEGMMVNFTGGKDVHGQTR